MIAKYMASMQQCTKPVGLSYTRCPHPLSCPEQDYAPHVGINLGADLLRQKGELRFPAHPEVLDSSVHRHGGHLASLFLCNDVLRFPEFGEILCGSAVLHVIPDLALDESGPVLRKYGGATRQDLTLKTLNIDLQKVDAAQFLLSQDIIEALEVETATRLIALHSGRHRGSASHLAIPYICVTRDYGTVLRSWPQANGVECYP
mmetsp:Transcript_52999/g.113750  ORF Transcript_52999/g.113750 Transcript_52999/m.113750 type:complete len:203 (+) Transcript_52999:129-737(+)